MPACLCALGFVASEIYLQFGGAGPKRQYIPISQVREKDARRDLDLLFVITLSVLLHIALNA